MKIIKANLKNLSILNELRKKLLKHHHKINPKNGFDKKIDRSESHIKNYLSKTYSRFYIAYIKDIPAGYVHATLDPNPAPDSKINAYLQDLYVEKKYRGNKIGTKLLEKAKEFFKENHKISGVTVDYCKTNKKTLNFYLKNNYKIKKVNDNIAYLIETKIKES